MDRRNFLKNTATAALVGGIGSAAAVAAGTKNSNNLADEKKSNPALCLIYGQLNQTGNRITEILADMDRLGISADIAVGLNYNKETIDILNAWSDKGNLVSPGFYPSDLDPKCPDANWHAYDEATCERLLLKAKERVLKAGYKKFDAIDTYTPGNGLVKAAKKLGIKHLTGFCGPEFANDTHWKFAQYGAPLIPYFASNEDFRKPEMPKDDNWFQIANMELRSPLTCYEHWNEGAFDPLNLIMGDRTIEPGDEPIESYAAVTDWLELSRLTDVPRLIIVDLQYFTSLKCFDLNKRFLIWLAEQRDLGRLRFAGLQEIAKLNKAAGGLMPQTTWYRGENMGQMCGGQAGDGNPCIVNESMAGQWVWRDGQSGPERAYHYNKVWDYPPFDETGSKPESFGYKADVKSKQTINGNLAEIKIDWNTNSNEPIYLCAWKALEGLAAPFKIESVNGILSAEAVPHPSGQGGALLFRASKSEGSAIVKIKYSGKGSDDLTRRWEELLVAETCWVRGRSVTRFSPLVPCRFQIPIRLKGMKTSRWEAILDGHASSGFLLPGQTVEFTLDGTRSATMFRLWDVTIADVTMPVDALKKEQIRLTAEAKAIAADLAPSCIQPTAPPMLGALAVIPE